MDGERFRNWEYPVIEDGKPTRYNWVVQHIQGFKLGHRTDIGAFTYINAKHGVTLEEEVQIGAHCAIYSTSSIDGKSGPVTLRKGCRIGAHTVIMPGVTVGENTVVGAHSFVNRDLPADSTAFGVPARVVASEDVEGFSNPVGRVFLSPPHLDGEERRYINEVLASNYIAPLGPQVDAFEADLATLTQRRRALAVSSGTAAMHLALRCLGVGEGDLVLASTLTFIGSVSPIIFQHATPVFVDSDRTSWNMDPELLEKALKTLDREGRRPKAIVPTDLYGQCADYEAIEALAARWEVPVVFDAAESLGARYKGRPAASAGRAAILSFNGNKIVTTSGGGALVSDDENLIAHARKLSQQARESSSHYEHREIGYNYRMSNVLAAIGRGQLVQMAERVNRRRRIFDLYREALADLPGLEFMPEPAFSRANRWLTVCLVQSAVCGANPEGIRLDLEKENIESRPLWKPMHLQPVFQGARVFGGAVAEDLYGKGLCLPSGSSMTPRQQRRVIDVVRKSYRRNTTKCQDRQRLQTDAAAPACNGCLT